LNGWYLAVRDVWMEEWDETNNAKAEPVSINFSAQKGFREVQGWKKGLILIAATLGPRL